jgi:hypothetical protein
MLKILERFTEEEYPFNLTFPLKKKFVCRRDMKKFIPEDKKIILLVLYKEDAIDVIILN